MKVPQMKWNQDELGGRVRDS